MNQVQKHQLKMALEVDRICKKYNINYFIEGGTLLGAIRHKGFIPWDDDLDIDMLRKDYDKFIQVAQKELGEKYFLQTLDTEKNYGLPFAKIRENNTLYLEKMAQNVKIHHGIYIDIFPLDHLSNTPSKNKRIVKKMIFYRMLLLIKQKYCVKTNTNLKKIIIIFLKIVSIFTPLSFIKRRINTIQLKYKNKDTKYVANLSSVYFDKAILEKNIVEEYVPLQFEDSTLMGLKKYDAYLKHFYNNYITPPPKNKRKNRHGIIKIELNIKKNK